jgi:hypothetical protein
MISIKPDECEPREPLFNALGILETLEMMTEDEPTRNALLCAIDHIEWTIQNTTIYKK